MLPVSSQLISIQYARAIASLLVVYSHLFGFDLFQVGGFPYFGGVGVDMFFVISGFIMWQTSTLLTPSEFVRRRLVRIVPAYWFFTLLLIAIFVLSPKLTPRVDFSTAELVKSLLFIPYKNSSGDNNPILQQGWTLNYEVYFYLVFTLGLLIRSLTTRFFLVAVILSLGAAIGIIFQPESAVLAMLCSTMLLEFVFGMVISAFFLIKTISKTKALAFLVMGICGLVACEVVSPQPLWRGVAYGISAASTVLGLIGLESVFRRKPNRVLLAIGTSSYALYLCHPFALSATNKLLFTVLVNPFGKEHNVLLALAFGFLGVIFACVLAWVSNVTVERYGQSLMKLIIHRKNPSRTRGSTITSKDEESSTLESQVAPIRRIRND